MRIAVDPSRLPTLYCRETGLFVFDSVLEIPTLDRLAKELSEEAVWVRQRRSYERFDGQTVDYSDRQVGDEALSAIGTATADLIRSVRSDEFCAALSRNLDRSVSAIGRTEIHGLVHHDFVEWHSDRSAERDCAIAIYLSEWRGPWGGAFRVRTGDGLERLVVPKISRLIVLDLLCGTEHSVDEIVAAGVTRVALTGWYG